MRVHVLSHSVISSYLQDFPSKNTGMGCHFLLQELFPTQGSNLHLLHWQADSFTIEPPGSQAKTWKQQMMDKEDVGCVCVCVKQNTTQALKKNGIVPFTATWMDLEY